MSNKELIAALEAGDGPGRELMLKAAQHLWGEMPFDGDDFTMPGPDYLESKWPRFLQLLGSEAWESAALMLVPEGWEAIHKWIYRESASVAIFMDADGDDLLRGTAKTEPLAIVIAVLKAMETEHDQ